MQLKIRAVSTTISTARMATTAAANKINNFAVQKRNTIFS